MLDESLDRVAFFPHPFPVHRTVLEQEKQFQLSLWDQSDGETCPPDWVVSLSKRTRPWVKFWD